MEVILIGFMVAVGVLVAGVVLVGALLLRAILWLALLPFRLLFVVLVVPFWILKVLFKLIATVVFAPVMAILGTIGVGVLLVVAAATLLLPLLPLLLVIALVWFVVRAISGRPALT